MNYYRAEEKQKGYNYECPESKTMKWMKQEFQDKMVKYLGNKDFVRKQTRMDKIYLKEQLNFENEINPIITVFTKVNRKIEHVLLFDALRAITAY